MSQLVKQLLKKHKSRVQIPYKIQVGVVTVYNLSVREAEAGGVWVKLAS